MEYPYSYMKKIADSVVDRAMSLYPGKPEMQQRYIRNAMRQRGNRTADNYADVESLMASKAAPVSGIGGSTREDADAFWRKRDDELYRQAYSMFGNNEGAINKFIAKKKAENPNKYDRERSEAYIRGAAAAAKQDLKKNTGFLASFGDPSYDKESTVLGGGGLWGAIRNVMHRSQHVNKNWVEGYNQYEGVDPVKAARSLAYRQVANEKAGQMARKQERQTAAWNHIEGNLWDSTLGLVVNPLMRHNPFGENYEDFSKYRTGSTTSEHASNYGQMAVDEFGEEAGRRAEKWLRAGGLAANAAGTVATTMATAGLASAAGNAARAVNASQAAAKAALASGKALSATQKLKLWTQANFIQNAGQSAIMTANRWRKLQQFSNLARGTADTITVGGTTTDPRFAIAGGILNTAADLAPVFSMEHAGNYILGKAVGIGGKIGLAAAGTGIGQKLLNSGAAGAVGKLVNNPVTSYAANTRAGQFVGNQLRQGVVIGVQNNIEDALAGTEQNYGPLAYTGMLGLGVMAAKPVLKGIMSKNDSLATMIQAGAAAKEQQASIDEIMADPDAVDELRQQLGDPAATDDQIRQYLPDLMAAQRHDNTMNGIYSKLDPNFDWANASQEAIDQHMASIPAEQRGKVFYDAYRKDVAMGGAIDPSMFSDKNLTQDQRKNLLGMYLQSEDNANGGTLIGQMFRGEKNVAVAAMQKSPYARQACVAYAAGVVGDFMNDPEGKGMEQLGDTAKAVLREMNPQEQAQAFAPMFTMPVSKLIDMQKNPSFASDPVIAEIGKNAVLERLRTDGNFAAEFIPAYSEAMKDGVGVTDADAARIRDMVSDIDPNEFLGSMDDDHFSDFARWITSSKGSTLLKDMPEDQRAALEDGFRQAAQQRAWQAVKNNPVKAIPGMVSMWLQSNGYEGMANFAGDPLAFWGTLGALVTGGVWFGKKLMSDNKDEQSEFMDDASALTSMNRQRELLMQM